MDEVYTRDLCSEGIEQGRMMGESALDENRNKQQVRWTQQHTFVICAYQESPYLEECIRSLLRQTVRSKILIATSTPTRYVLKLADWYKIAVIIHKGGSLARDWNAALECVQTEYATLASG